jgi:hypothetical protein
MYKKELNNIRKEFNEVLKKEKEHLIPSSFFYKWIKCIKASSDYEAWIDALEKYIWNDPFYIKHGSAYCRFLELEYKNRNRIVKLI